MKKLLKKIIPAALVPGLAFLLLLLAGCKPEAQTRRPNILMIMSDNHSWNHVGSYGDKVVRTPHIDRIASQGVRFTNAFCNSPSCTPARGALLTGQDIWRLGEGANLWGTLPARLEVYPDLLERSGYQVGFTGKGWGPGNYKANGRKRNPAGTSYESFASFLESRQQGQPWSYWLSSRHPHRPYVVGSGAKAGIDPDQVQVPAYLPDTKEVRGDIADYYAAIETFDREVGQIMEQLRKSGELDNTIVIVCSDNGWQMPRGLANLYDFGTRVPLIISWPGKFSKGEVVDQLVTLKDLAPTFLELARVAVPATMTGKSLLPLVSKNAKASGRDFVVLGRERHAFVRRHGLSYPGRALRTKDFLYIRNFEPDRWPAGDPPLYGDVDPHMFHYPGPAKTYMVQHQNKPDVKALFGQAFAKRPAEELFDLRQDPDQQKNLAFDPQYQAVRDSLSAQLRDYLQQTQDPRVTGGRIIWDTIPYFAENDKRAHPGLEARHILGLDSVYNYLD